MMLTEAIAAGGGIAAGGTVATYQSIGVVDLGSAAGPIGIAVDIIGGFVVGVVVYIVWNCTRPLFT
jgi:hypothetical protein